jgi:hypothetical protein
MALRQNQGSRLHFWVRASGLTGLLILAVGLVVLFEAPDNGLDGDVPWRILAHYWETFPDWLSSEHVYVAVAGVLLAVGAGLLLLALLIELPGAVRLAFSSRAALGSNVFLQITLAIILFVGINVFSFFYHWRFDLTRDGIFTIAPAIRQQLAGLRGETTIVLYQRHSSFGQLGEKSDNYDAAAERQIVEKVKDLVDEFRELGPRFRVAVFDIQDEGYQDKLAALRAESPALGNAIETAPENSIFFFSRGESPPGSKETAGAVQRLSFHDVYQLDKQASRQADRGNGNLVLRSQGVKPFANRILNIDEKKPRVAVAVIHELLGLDDPQDWGMSGAKKVLAARGFESKDIVLKKWSESAMPEPAVLTYDESKYERLDEEINEANDAVKQLSGEITELQGLVKEWQTKPPAELVKTDLAKSNRITKVDAEIREAVLQQLQQNIVLRDMILKQARQQRDSASQEQSGLNVENLSEQRRIADLRAKFNRMLADTDLLIVPRMTLRNVARNDAIPSWVHGLDAAQLDAIKDFMKAGKPVLFCLGPANESPSRPAPPGVAPDRLEDMLGELGIQMPRQTVLFNAEAKSFAERRSGFLVLGNPTEVPPVEFDWPPGAGQVGPVAPREARKPNPVRESMRLAAGGLGSDLTLGLRLRHPRPVYYEAPKNDAGSPDAVLMMTSPEAWNENQPFPTREHIPRFQQTKPGDSDKGTIREERRGQFPIAVAVETRLPASWYEGKEVNAATVRLAVIGQGEVFSGTTLNPAKEKLLLDVSNWLLGRDDLLAREDAEPWHYPRVTLTDAENGLWQWGTRLGMPLFFVYLGLMVFMVRRMR